MLMLTCMLLLPFPIEQGNQTGEFHFDPEKDRHRAERRVELLPYVRPKADRAGRLIGRLVLALRTMIEARLNRIILTEDQQEARHWGGVLLSFEAHELALQPRQPMKMISLL